MSDDLTDEELEMLRQGIRDLGLIDARMAVLKQTVCRYADQNRVATGYFQELLDDAIQMVGAWQEFSASPFGAMFDPQVIPPEEDDEA